MEDIDTSIPALGNPKEDIGYLIWRISKTWQRGKNAILSEFGLTGSQLEMLGAVYHMTRVGNMPVTQIILSQETEIDPMTTSTILRNLEKKGLLNRKESKTDTRARLVEITAEGTTVFEKAIRELKAFQNQMFVGMDKKTIVKNLQLILTELDSYSKKSTIKQEVKK